MVGALSDDARLISVCLTSDVCLSVAYVGPKSRTEKPRKIKIGTEVAHVTRDSDTTFRVKRSKVNLQGAGAYCGGLPHRLLYLIIIISKFLFSRAGIISTIPPRPKNPCYLVVIIRQVKVIQNLIYWPLDDVQPLHKISLRFGHWFLNKPVNRHTDKQKNRHRWKQKLHGGDNNTLCSLCYFPKLSIT